MAILSTLDTSITRLEGYNMGLKTAQGKEVGSTHLYVHNLTPEDMNLWKV